MCPREVPDLFFLEEYSAYSVRMAYRGSYLRGMTMSGREGISVTVLSWNSESKEIQDMFWKRSRVRSGGGEGKGSSEDY